MLFDSIAAQVSGGATRPIDIDALVAGSGLQVPELVVQSLKMTQQTRGPWFDAFLTLNPREFLPRVKCPVLAVNGDKDRQVYPDNLAVIRELVPQADARLMPGLNHLMQHADSGEMAEYDSIRETISPEVLDAIVQVIRAQGGAPHGG